MSKVEQIEQEIAQLPHDDFMKLADWLDHRREELEEREDRLDAEEAQNVLREGGPTVSWESIRQKHGLA